ncbi:MULTISPECIES: ureidoglycolate lyase [Yersinia]|uniref:Ureidoglycolate hydrolase n=1 Tax=Yersinia intermedia TaxID=631 RepID=A0A0T9N1N4_YERIN|nr:MULTISPECIES: ureidoglycolate lyase [Yersinia]AJJ18538.1 ureidoglycolate hydrolase [Yersinia intermedia]ARB84692.1 ureidoglycolate lyase [Yersinia sp. FDAARGOS_228]AVL34474.1 ureidoglycolate lyase [Yersinia intermedia]EEQ19766.1 Ureidoglycolate hydrolase [Yersinia intermedia ATCC 29909]MCW8113732.1 ureidoglycolate lyase [Yersinia intermedia]
MELRLEQLTAEAFAPYGDVIQVEGNDFFHINNGKTERYHDLAKVEVTDGRRVLVSINRSQPCEMPLIFSVLEKHPLSSQAFIPMNGERFITIVALGGDEIPLNSLRAFITNGRQGVSYHCNVWHHPLFAYEKVTDFLTIDRGGADNCIVGQLPEPYRIIF